MAMKVFLAFTSVLMLFLNREKGDETMMRCVFALTVLLVASGCANHTVTRATVHPHSAVTAPTFCAYSESDSDEQPKRSRQSEPRAIARLEVILKREQERPELDEAVWVMHYRPDSLYDEFKPYSCITYGKLPPGYRERAPAVPLIPERSYRVHLVPRRGWSNSLVFNIRTDTNGKPVRLEYSNEYPPTIKTIPRQ